MNFINNICFYKYYNNHVIGARTETSKHAHGRDTYPTYTKKIGGRARRRVSMMHL
jgi:hypothetical protein